MGKKGKKKKKLKKKKINMAVSEKKKFEITNSLSASKEMKKNCCSHTREFLYLPQCGGALKVLGKVK